MVQKATVLTQRNFKYSARDSDIKWTVLQSLIGISTCHYRVLQIPAWQRV